MRAFDIRNKILQEIETIDGQLDAARVASPFDRTIQQTEKAYDDLTQIHEQRERYNVSWAFYHASDTIQTIISRVFSNQLKKKIADYANTFKNRRRKQSIEKRFSVIQRALTDKIDKTRTSPKVFKTATAVIFFVEVLLTLAIVLLITQLFFYVDRNITVPQVSLLFLAVFGILRLLLHQAKTRFLHNWSWRLYQDAVDTAFEGIAIVMATSFVLAYHVKRGIFLETKLDTLLARSLRQLQEPPSRELRRKRRALHQAARLKSLKIEKIQRLRCNMEYLSLQEAFDFGSIQGKAKKPRGSFIPSNVISAFQNRGNGKSQSSSTHPSNGSILSSPLDQGEKDAGDQGLQELPSQESLLSPDALDVLKKRTNRIMDYLTEKFSIHKSKDSSGK